MSINTDFLIKLQEALALYLTNGARSDEKLKPVHAFIADTLRAKLNDPEIEISSLRPGERGGEKCVPGRYMEKRVDVAVCKEGRVLGAVGFKFVMSNYKQNSNNYFEGMLGETANIRCNHIPYFQVLVLLRELPYYKKDGTIAHWEEVDQHNLDKYIKLSQDDKDVFFHAPVKTLLYIVQLPQVDKNRVRTKQQYQAAYLHPTLTVDNTFAGCFQRGIIVNNLEEFISKIACYIQFAQ